MTRAPDPVIGCAAMKRLPSVLGTLALLAAIGCGPSGRDPGSNNGGVDAGGNTGGGDGGGGGGGDECSEDAKFIYAVDDGNDLLKYDPGARQFTSLGQLGCPAGGTPFSMGVDRNAVAYVLYSTGDLYRLDTKTPANCTRTNWSTQNGLELFGMGFSTDTAGGSADKLFIAGGPDAGGEGNQTLAVLDVNTMQSQVIGQVQGSPELTGTGGAELWGFFPGNNPRIAQLNKTSGAQGMAFSLPALNGQPLAWAFAFHGGDFHVFLMKDFDSSTTVYHVDGTTGAVKNETSAGGRAIVGAGVSTCAPVIL